MVGQKSSFPPTGISLKPLFLYPFTSPNFLRKIFSSQTSSKFQREICRISSSNSTMLQPEVESTKVLCLPQVVSPEDLINDADYEDILEDVRQEAAKYGALVSVVIPRPRPNEEIPGVGKVFLEYADVEGAVAARAGLNGRQFAGKQVVPQFYPENMFAQAEYDA